MQCAGPRARARRAPENITQKLLRPLLQFASETAATSAWTTPLLW